MAAEGFRIGYALAQKKTTSFLQEKLLQQAARKGVLLIAIDPGRELVEQGPFDAILHKLLGPDWTRQLEAYCSRYPDVIIVDPPEAIQRLHNRLSMLQAVAEERAYDSYGLVGIPKQLMVTAEKGDKGIVEQFEGSELKYPVIAKPLVADGTALSHRMWLVYNRQGLEKLHSPFLLQEFVNHGGVIFKVYVVDNYVKCCRRKSLPDVHALDLNDPEGLQSFSQISNASHSSASAESIDASLAYAPLPPMKLVVAISARLRRKLGLRLFNYDLIRASDDPDHFCIIDINYFPGYAKMPDYEKVLTDFFVSLAKEKMQKARDQSCSTVSAPPVSTSPPPLVAAGDTQACQ